MRRPAIVVFLVVAVVVAGVGGWILLRPPGVPAAVPAAVPPAAVPPAALVQPAEGGKHLSEWIADLKSNDYAKVRTAQLVVAAVGPDARGAADALLRPGANNPAPQDGLVEPLKKAVQGIGPDALPTYFAALASDSEPVRWKAVYAIQSLDVDDATLAAELVKLFEAHANDPKKVWAAVTLAEKLKAPNKAVADKLKPLLKNADLAPLAARGLSKADPTSVEAVAYLLDVPYVNDGYDAEMQRAEVLRRFGATAVGPIAEKVKNPAPANTRFIASLPADATAAAAVPAVAAAAARPNIAPITLEFLTRLGPVAKDAIPVLRRQLTSGHYDALRFLQPLVALGADPKELLPLAVAAATGRGEAIQLDNVTAFSYLGPVAKDTLRRGLEYHLDPKRLAHPRESISFAQRMQALEAWQRVDPQNPDLLAAALDALNHREDQFYDVPRLVALLQKFPREAVLAGLRPRLAGPAGEPRLRAAATLFLLDPTDEPATAVLVEQAARDPARQATEPLVFKAAAAAGEAAVPLLIKLAGHPEPFVRARADTDFRFLGPKAKATAAVMKARLTDPSPKVRCDAVRLLYAVDPTAKDAVPVILDLFRPENHTVLRSAELAPTQAHRRDGWANQTARLLADILFDLDPVAAVKADVNAVAWGAAPPQPGGGPPPPPRPIFKQ